MVKFLKYLNRRVFVMRAPFSKVDSQYFHFKSNICTRQTLKGHGHKTSFVRFVLDSKFFTFRIDTFLKWVRFAGLSTRCNKTYVHCKTNCGKSTKCIKSYNVSIPLSLFADSADDTLTMVSYFSQTISFDIS